MGSNRSGKNGDSNDTIKYLRDKLRSFEIENKRLRKLLNRHDNNISDNQDIKHEEKRHKKPEKIEQAPACEKCNSKNVRTFELEIRGVLKTYTRCNECKHSNSKRK